MLEHVAYRVYLSISIEYLELFRPHLERLAREGKKGSAAHQRLAREGD